MGFMKFMLSLFWRNFVIKTGKYDLYVSLGDACSCSSSLRNSKLQFYSYPLDWIHGASFIERIELLTNNFAHYIDKEDLKFSYEARSIACNAYYNKANGITFNHDFKKDVPFDEMYETVFEKYKRRAKRLYSQIESSQKVLFVFLQSPNERKILPDEELVKGFNKLKIHFSNVEINLLYIFCERDKKLTQRLINKNIQQLIFDYDARDENAPYVVNFKTIDKLFRHFSISKKHLTKENIKDIQNYKRKLLLRGKLLWKKI